MTYPLGEHDWRGRNRQLRWLGPGFGIVAAVVALLAGAALRRQRR